MDLIKQLRGIRRQQKMSQKAMGVRISVSKQHISNIENGRVGASYEVIEKMADVLGHRIALIVENGNFKKETLTPKTNETKTD